MDEAIRELRSQLAVLTARVSALEGKTSAPLPKLESPKTESPNLEKLFPPISPAPLRVVKPSEPIGGKLLGGAAVICFVLAAVILIRLAVDSGWLTPIRQIGIAAFFGLSLIGAGYALRETDAPYASMLPGAGLTILWASVYASYGLYGLFSPWNTLCLLWILCGLSFTLFESFRQPYFLVIMVVGAYTMPLLIHLPVLHQIRDQVHFLIWDVLFCLLAIRLESRRLMTLAAYFALIVFYLVNMAPGMSVRHGELTFAAFQLLQFVLFGAFILRFSVIRKEPLSEAEAWYLAPALLFFYGTEYSFIYTLAPAAAPWAALGFAGLLGALELFAQGLFKELKLPSRVVVVSMIAVILFHAGYGELLPAAEGHWLSLFLLLCWPFLEQRGFTFKTYPVAVFAYWLVILVEFCKPFELLGQHGTSISEVAFSGIYTILLLGSYFGSRDSDLARRGPMPSAVAYAFIFGASAQAWVAAERIAHFSSQGSTVEMNLSALVAVYAFVLMALARRYGDRVAANGAMITFMAVSLKILTVDLSESTSIVKIVTLLIVGALLYGGGMISRQIKPLATDDAKSSIA